MRVFFENAKGFEFFVFVESFAFLKPILVKSVLDFAGRAEIGSQDCDDTDND